MDQKQDINNTTQEQNPQKYQQDRHTEQNNDRHEQYKEPSNPMMGNRGPNPQAEHLSQDTVRKIIKQQIEKFETYIEYKLDQKLQTILFKLKQLEKNIHRIEQYIIKDNTNNQIPPQKQNKIQNTIRQIVPVIGTNLIDTYNQWFNNLSITNGIVTANTPTNIFGKTNLQKQTTISITFHNIVGMVGIGVIDAQNSRVQFHRWNNNHAFYCSNGTYFINDNYQGHTLGFNQLDNIIMHVDMDQAQIQWRVGSQILRLQLPMLKNQVEWVFYILLYKDSSVQIHSQ